MAVQCPSHRWIVYSFCMCALTILGYKSACTNSLNIIVYNVISKKNIHSGDCPFVFSETFWDKRGLSMQLPDYYWNKKMTVLGNAYYTISKTLLAVPAGALADLGYCRYTLGGGMFLVATGHLLLPLAFGASSSVYVTHFFLDGIADALIFPSICTVLSMYTPPSKRNFHVAFVEVGYYCGAVLGTLLFDTLFVGNSLYFGNRSIGVLGAAWCLCWVAYTQFAPVKCQSDVGSHCRVGSRQRGTSINNLLRLALTPWRKIFFSGPLLSMVLVYISMFRSNIIADLKRYQDVIMNLPLSLTKLTSTVNLASVPSTLLGGFVADWLVQNHVMSKIQVKRYFIFFAVVCSGVFQFCQFVLTGCDATVFWAFSFCVFYVEGIVVPVIYSTPIDTYPQDAGLIMGVMVSAKTLTDRFDTFLLQGALSQSSYRTDWQSVFIGYGILNIALILPFMFFGSAEEQKWYYWRGRPLVRKDTAANFEQLPEPSGSQNNRKNESL